MTRPLIASLILGTLAAAYPERLRGWIERWLSSTLAHFSAPSSPARSVIARSRCDSLKIPSLASASGPSGGLMPPELAH